MSYLQKPPFVRVGISMLVVCFAIINGCSHNSDDGEGRKRDSTVTTVERIARTLADMDIEHHWLAGKHVDWQTGDPDGLPVSPTGYHTHCSAFVAAVCKRLGIQILEPPQHPQELLADAQSDWLQSDAGRKAGWSEVKDAFQANEFAGEGKLVIAVYKNPDTAEPGHIAIVIPSTRSVEEIEKDGPDIAQAGKENFARTTVRIGFKNHPEAWETSRDIRFFTHAVPR